MTVNLTLQYINYKVFDYNTLKNIKKLSKKMPFQLSNPIKNKNFNFVSGNATDSMTTVKVSSLLILFYVDYKLTIMQNKISNIGTNNE